MLHAVASLLDAEHTERLNKLWDELQREFGLPGRYVRPWAHVSYHVAGDYQIDQLEPVLAGLASRIAPFGLVTTGLGLFTGKIPILMIPAVRTPALQAVHDAVWAEIGPGAPHAGIASKPSELYPADRWVPHLSLAMGEADAARTGELVSYLAAREPFHWQIRIDNLVLIYNPGSGHEVRLRFPLTGS